MSNISASAFSDTKAHYELLDGLRGVAAFMVIWYHVFEGFAFAGLFYPFGFCDRLRLRRPLG